MAYAYWHAGRHTESAIFELFFRKCPFKGEYVIFAGVDQVVRFLRNFSFTDDDIAYLRSLPALAGAADGFFEYLAQLDCSEVTVKALPEGTICFPRVTLISVQGPLIVGQLLETTLLNLVNFPSLIATNAARMRLAAGVRACVRARVRLSVNIRSFVRSFVEASKRAGFGRLFGLLFVAHTACPLLSLY